KLKVRKAKPAGQILLAEKKVDGNTVTVHLGKLDEKTKEAIAGMGLEVEGLEGEERDKAKPFGKKRLYTRKEPDQRVIHKKIIHKEETRGKILAYKDWTLYVLKVKDRPYLYARRYDKERKKMIRKALGPLTNEALKVIKEYDLKVKGLTE
ncbi:MAG: hypothetical protein ACTSXC_07075, partial [Candidatus Freyarchaeota archaeon]